VIELAVALPTAAVAGFAARWVGPRIGALDRPDAGLKAHARAVPFLGGVAVAAGVAAGLGSRGWPIPAGVAVAVFAPLALGLADDSLGLPAPARLAAQVALGVVMVWGGLAATALPGRVLADGGAVVLYVAALNAVNMADGMDGLAGGLAAISGAGVAVVAAGQGRAGILAVATAAAAVGFLLHNLPPARLFLGDNGSYLLGGALAVAVLQTGRTVAALAGAAGCLGLFLLDLVLALLRRAAGRVPLHVGDRGHVYDQLLARGRSMWATLAWCWGAHAVLVGSGVAAARLSTAGALVLQGVVWAGAIAGLFAFGFVGYRQEASAS
jgi:UDP-GlcNAc:undecaprenyl-phosphate/decaprenyl-phosphate GlcNAc-1-phosphate transferase